MAYSLADKLYANKPFEETVDVLGRRVTFRVLGAAEEDEISRGVVANDVLSMIQGRRIPCLARAIRAIDGCLLEESDEIKQRLRSTPGLTLVSAVEAELRQPCYTEDVVNDLFQAYTAFRQRYRDSLEGLKKNSEITTPAPVG